MPAQASPLPSDWKARCDQVWARDHGRCRDCGEECVRGEGDVHHLVPRSAGGSHDLENLALLCDGCHAARHPNLQLSLARRVMERWALRLARWLDRQNRLPEDVSNLRPVLKDLGVERLRPGQLEAILEALAGRSVLVIRPTGSGKSLCFQLPALMRPGTAVVVTPLKALMSDQVVALVRKKIPGTFLNSDLGAQEKEIRHQELEKGMFKFLYAAPERFDPSRTRPEEAERLLKLRPSFLVVDEAHCIARWGDDFRPSYGRLGEVRQALGNPPVLALTATAGAQTRRRILESLGMPDARVLLAASDRPNIALVRLPLADEARRHELVACHLQSKPGRAMIFVPSIPVGKAVQEGLRGHGVDLPFYHSGAWNSHERDLVLGRFSGRLDPPLDAVICTNAFGMGLDIPDVRLVVHWQHPASPEDYLQEFGRAGRDGKTSLALLLTGGSKDAHRLRFMADRSIDDAKLDPKAAEELKAARHAQIDAIGSMAQGTTCFRRALLAYFESEQRPSKPSWSIRILEWVYARRVPGTKKARCCDACFPQMLDAIRGGKVPVA